MKNIDSIITESINRFLKEEGIHIKKENEGKFTATKKATGKSTEELTHSKNPLTRKRAVFAQNAKKWHHKGKKKLEEVAVKQFTPYTPEDRERNFSPITGQQSFSNDEKYNQLMIQKAKEGSRGAIRYCKNNGLQF